MTSVDEQARWEDHVSSRGAIAELIQKSIPGTSVSVVQELASNSWGCKRGSRIGFGTPLSSVDGVAGRDPFKAPTRNVMQLANLYPQYFQMVVSEDSGINGLWV